MREAMKYLVIQFIFAGGVLALAFVILSRLREISAAPTFPVEWLGSLAGGALITVIVFYVTNPKLKELSAKDPRVKKISTISRYVLMIAFVLMQVYVQKLKHEGP